MWALMHLSGVVCSGPFPWTALGFMSLGFVVVRYHKRHQKGFKGTQAQDQKRKQSSLVWESPLCAVIRINE